MILFSGKNIKKGSRTDIVQGVFCDVGLFTVRDIANNENKSNLSESHTHAEFKKWLENTCHIGNELVQQLAEKQKDVPNFEPAVMRQIACVPRVNIKIKRETVRTAPELDHDGVIPLDFSRPMTPSLGERIYAAHFLKPTPGTSDAIPIKKNSDLPDLFLPLIRLLKNHYYREKHRFLVLRCDSA